jgi:hypothetical protein
MKNNNYNFLNYISKNKKYKYETTKTIFIDWLNRIKESKKYIDELLNKNQIEYRLYEDINVEKRETEKVIDWYNVLMNDFDILNNMYVSPNVSNELNNMISKNKYVVLEVETTMMERKLRLSFIIDKNEVERKDINSINKFIEYDNNIYILLILYVFLLSHTNANSNSNSSNICSKEGLHIIIYYSKELKKLDREKTGYIEHTERTERTQRTERKIINANNANSGLTYSCQKEGRIFIYREEEWFKVCIHELFHNLGFDFSQYCETKCMKYMEKRMKKLYKNIDSSFLLYESYCEIFALLINVCFLSVFGNKYRNLNKSVSINKMNEDEYLNKCREKLINEIIFSQYQAIKILNYNNIFNYKDIISSLAINKKEDTNNIVNIYRENTNIFMYYIIKALLLYYYEDFLRWSIKNNNNLIISGKNLGSRYRYNNDSKNVIDYVDKFIDFIEMHYDKNEYTDFMDNISREKSDVISYLKQHYNKIHKNKKNIEDIDIENTMRMTFS